MGVFAILPRYVGRQFVQSFLLLLIILSSVIVLFELIEMVRRISGRPDSSFGIALQMTLLKVPQTLELLFHFTVLFSAMFTFWRLTRNHELVVARAAGVSVWQFLLPVVMVAALIGVARVSVINPLGAAMYSRFEEMANRYIYGLTSIIEISPNGLWLRQQDEDGSSIIFAERAEPDRLLLRGVTVFLFDPEDRHQGRIDAASAALQDGHWLLRDAWVSRGPNDREFVPELERPTRLTLDSIQDSFASPHRLSFWQLPGFIATLEQIGFSSIRHRLHYQSLLAQPLLLVAMVLFAAAFSLRLTRRGGHVLLVAAGVGTGFMLFLMTDVMRALGQTETIPIALAAWTPAAVSVLVGTALLLHLEDG